MLEEGLYDAADGRTDMHGEASSRYPRPKPATVLFPDEGNGDGARSRPESNLCSRLALL